MKVLLITITLTVLAGCSSGGGKNVFTLAETQFGKNEDPPKKLEKKSGSEKGDNSDFDESVDEPVMTGGTFLTLVCAADYLPANQIGATPEEQGVIGCRLEKDGVKYDIPADANFQVEAETAGGNAAINVADAGADSPWHWIIWHPAGINQITAIEVVRPLRKV